MGKTRSELREKIMVILYQIDIYNERKLPYEIDEVIKNRIILYTTKRLLGSTKGIEKIHIKDIIKLCHNNIGNKFLTPNKNIKILIKDKKIQFIAL